MASINKSVLKEIYLTIFNLFFVRVLRLLFKSINYRGYTWVVYMFATMFSVIISLLVKSKIFEIIQKSNIYNEYQNVLITDSLNIILVFIISKMYMSILTNKNEFIKSNFIMLFLSICFTLFYKIIVSPLIIASPLDEKIEIIIDDVIKSTILLFLADYIVDGDVDNGLLEFGIVFISTLITKLIANYTD
jgi:hypothetical protein